MKRLIFRIKLFFKRVKTKNKMIGKNVKLVKCPTLGKPTSGNGNIGRDGVFKITGNWVTGNCYKGYNICDSFGNAAGWVYEYEIEGGQTVQDMENEIKEMEEKISCLKSKIEWMNEVGSTEYDEDEFKVYETLKTLQNNDLSLKVKTKLIASLIKGNKC